MLKIFAFTGKVFIKILHLQKKKVFKKLKGI